mmetsp:Transcript_3853/g.11974  ORF Transcript_3853/g.11974 Transcript_3853/m.11974 type:complete len:209 (+) Transcript_3853:565-1191(+)
MPKRKTPADDDESVDAAFSDDGDEESFADDGGDAADDGGDSSSDDESDEEERNAVLAEMAAQQRIAAADEEGDEEEEDDDDESLVSVEERVTRKGRTVYQVRLCPDTAPFTTRAAADEFMRGEKYRKALKRELRAVRSARRGLAEAAMSDAERLKRDARASKSRDKRRAKAKERKKAKVKDLSADQIAARKQKFQRKKARRAARKAGE